ncbi:MAG: TRAP transporter small permease subunit [Spirochaetales bacterium]|nr:TRAP transporter small permease subunit [Spirochaetales bacterium]
MPEERKKRKYILEEYFVSVVLILMLVLYFVNVVSRFTINFPILFTDSLLTSLFPWVTFLGAPAVCFRKMNIAFTLVTDHIIPRKYQKYVELFTTVVSIFLFSLLLYYGLVKTINDFQYNNTINNLNNAPRWIFSAGIPMGAAAYIIRTAQVSVRAFRSKNEKGGPL